MTRILADLPDEDIKWLDQLAITRVFCIRSLE
jgi:hypothetical protein